MPDQTNLKTWFLKIAFPTKIFFASRIILFIIAYISLSVFPARIGTDLLKPYPDKLYLDGWVRWDSSWYYDIAKNGYSYTPSPNIRQQNIAYFPLYPYMVRYLNHLVGDFYLSGIIIANISFLFAIIGLYLLLSSQYTQDIANNSILLLAFSPFSFFFSAMYSESLFLFSVVFAFLFASKKKWLLSSLFAAAAGATRLVGILCILPILFFYLQDVHFNLKSIKLNILSLSTALLGPLSYMAYLTAHFGNPLIFLQVYKAPGWNEGVNLKMALLTIKNMFLRLISANGDFGHGMVFGMNEIHLINLIISFGLLLLVIKKIHPAYSLWALTTIIASFSGWVSMSRYLVVVFPIYLAAALLIKEKHFNVVLACSACLLSMYTILFSHWFWIS